MERFLIVFDTDDLGLYLQCTPDGNLMINEVEDRSINAWTIFQDVEDKEILKEIVRIMDIKGIKRSKHIIELLPDLFKDEGKLQKISITVMDQVIIVYGVKVKNYIRKYFS